MSFDDQEILLDHLKNPRGSVAIVSPVAQAQKLNSACGDTVILKVGKGGAGEELRIAFEAKGCVLSRASASILCELCDGKSREELENLLANVMNAFKPGNARQLAEFGDLRYFNDIEKFPTRRACVLLPWSALESCIAEMKNKGDSR